MASNKKRVFLMTDYFTRSNDYYVVASSEADAIENGRIHHLPDYIEERDLEFESSDLQEEVATLMLVRNIVAPGQHSHVCIVPTDTEKPDAYYGYQVLIEEEKIDLIENRYPKSEWRQVGLADLDS